MSQQYQQPYGSVGQGSFGGQGGQIGSMGTSQGTQEPMGQSMGGQTGTQFGSQTGTSHQTTHQQVGQQFESELTPELNTALESFDRVVEIASWCADKCIEMGPEMAECARLCDDLAELAELNEKLIARDSINGPEIAEAYLRVAQQGIPILQQYSQSPHVQETLQAVDLSINATNQLLASIGGQRQQGFQELAQQEQFQQPQGGQQFQQPQGQMSQQYSTGGQFTESY
jgi:hypothetical protein